MYFLSIKQNYIFIFNGLLSYLVPNIIDENMMCEFRKKSFHQNYKFKRRVQRAIRKREEAYTELQIIELISERNIISDFDFVFRE